MLNLWSVINQKPVEPFWSEEEDMGNEPMGDGVGTSTHTFVAKQTGIYLSQFRVEEVYETLNGKRTRTREDYYEVYAFSPASYDGCSGGDEILLWKGFGLKYGFLEFYKAHLEVLLDSAEYAWQEHQHDSCDFGI